MSENTKDRTERLLGMDRAQLVMECQDVTRQRDELLAVLDFYANPQVYEPDALGRRDDISFIARAAIERCKP